MRIECYDCHTVINFHEDDIIGNHYVICSRCGKHIELEELYEIKNNMEFKSQICTTKEQSERLLALGLKKETADMEIHSFKDDEQETFETGYANKGYMEPEMACLVDCFPAWSLHRLIEIYDKTCKFWTDCRDNPYEAMISRIADKIKWRELNKEYLEE